LLILVAAVALGIGAEQMRRRRAYCLKMADWHRSRLYMTSFHFAVPRSSLTPEKEAELRRTYPHAAWHLNVSDAYRRCASRPWEPVPTEPTEPSVFPDPPG
jgi:hypothetical protein